MSYRGEQYFDELRQREKEALRLFRPQPHQLPIFQSKATELLIIGGNRAGKTTCTAALIASAITGMPIIGPDEKPLPLFYPTNRPLQIWLIGKEKRHCATWHKMLLEPQPELKIVRDEKTGLFRGYDRERDQGREDVDMMGPMVPHRFIQGGYKGRGISWDRERDRIFYSIRFNPLPDFPKDSPGSVIHFFPSNGEVRKGESVDLIAIDEHIIIYSHYPEWRMRILDRKGRIIWPITPATARNPALNDLQLRCDREENNKNPDCQRFVLKLSQNKYIDEEEKRKAKAALSARDWANRDAGVAMDADAQVYPEFREAFHSSPPAESAEEAEVILDAVDKKLIETNGAIPADWCREIVIDPGSAHPGALLCAIPPPELGDCGVIYDEVYLPNSDHNLMAVAIAERACRDVFERFIIDYRAAVQRTIGTVVGKNTYLLHAEAFARVGLTCEQTGSNFQVSETDWLAGTQGVKQALAPQRNGRPWLRIVRGRCYNLCRMLEMYERRIDSRGFAEDKPAPKQIDCLCDCVRYWVMSQPVYRMPPDKKPKGSRAWQAYQMYEEEKQRAAKERGFHLGPGAAPTEWRRCG